MIFDKRLANPPAGHIDPSIHVTRYSETSTIQIMASNDHSHFTILTLTADTANRLGWALLEAVVAKKLETEVPND
jgi:hypothetical protein